jgi:hypothetical protein
MPVVTVRVQAKKELFDAEVDLMKLSAQLEQEPESLEVLKAQVIVHSTTADERLDERLHAVQALLRLIMCGVSCMVPDAVCIRRAS